MLKLQFRWNENTLLLYFTTIRALLGKITNSVTLFVSMHSVRVHMYMQYWTTKEN